MEANPFASPAGAGRRGESWRMSFRASCVLVALGLSLLIGSVLYPIIVLGIPPQDPTPLEIASSNFHHGVSLDIAVSGIVVTLIGFVAVINATAARPFPRRNR